MRVENEIIVEATESELYKYWLKQDWCEIYSFPEYVELCKEHGTNVAEVDNG